MDRREFIKDSCMVCLSAAGFAAMTSSCTPVKYIKGTLDKDGLFINTDDFKINRKGENSFRSYIIVRNEALQYPVCVYRFNENEYSALWMRCTHQGTELQVAGDYLQCTAHGSEFNNKGAVKTGPADKDLRSFPVRVNNNQIFIDLRAV
jgi:nitrite reductase/ring-hydroxylating ferredoxin subunit